MYEEALSNFAESSDITLIVKFSCLDCKYLIISATLTDFPEFGRPDNTSRGIFQTLSGKRFCAQALLTNLHVIYEKTQKAKKREQGNWKTM